MKNYPTAYQLRTLWNAATGVSILILGLLLVGLIWITGEVFHYLQPVLVPVIAAGIIAYLLDPLVRWFQRKCKFTRIKAVLAVFALMLLTFLLLTLAILPGVLRSRELVMKELKPTATQAVPGNAEQEDARFIAQVAKTIHGYQKKPSGISSWLLENVDDEGKAIAVSVEKPKDLEFFWKTRAGRFLEHYKGTLWNWFSSGASKLVGIMGLIVGLFLVPIYLFYFLKDSASIEESWHNYVPLRASAFKSEVVSTLQEINGYLISFFRGQVVVGFIDGLLVGIALTIYGLPYGFLIGIFMTILGVVPYIGHLICLVPACIIAWFHAQAEPVFFQLSPVGYTAGVVIIFIAVNQINSLFTAPKIVGESVGLHPMTVMFSMFFWTVILGGFVGALLAVPLTAAIKVLFRRYIWERKIMQPSESASAVNITQA